jgi:formate-dependent nitrite reductase membrane component NrfD
MNQVRRCANRDQYISVVNHYKTYPVPYENVSQCGKISPFLLIGVDNFGLWITLASSVCNAKRKPESQIVVSGWHKDLFQQTLTR